MKLDPVRQRLVDLVDERGTTLAVVSRAIGKNHSYLQQYVKYHSPQRLSEEVREALGRHLRVPPDTFRDAPPTRAEPARLGGDELLVRNCVIAVERYLAREQRAATTEAKADLVASLFKGERDAMAAGRPGLSGVEVVEIMERVA